MAADATWSTTPGSGDFNTAANWSPAAVPDGTATFGASATTNLSFSSSTTLARFTVNSESYGFVLNGPDVLTFTGAGIVINGGSVSIINNAGAGIDFRNGSTAGAAAINNFQSLTFWDASTAGNTAIANYSSLGFRDSSSAGDATIINNVGGIDFREASTAANATINNTNIGVTTRFWDSSTAANATITNAGTLDFRGTSTAANAHITTANGGTTTIRETGGGGTARFVTHAGGAVDISNLSHLSAGITAGSIEGAGSYVLGAKNLEAGSNDLSTTVSGVISGTSGSLTKTGDGTLTLSGTNTYTGATTVAAGTLLVNGSIASSSLTSLNAGRLGGTGTVGNAAINGGILAPGNSIGTMTVNGNLAFAPGATYEAEVSPLSGDRTDVTGTASLDGTAHATFQPGWYLEQNYTILSAAGGLGGTTFDNLITTSLPSGFAAGLDYVGNDVLLTLTATSTTPPNGGGIGQNQQGAANAIAGFFNDGGSLPSEFVTVLSLSGEEQKTALSQLSGEATAAARAGTAQASSQFLGTMFAPRTGGAVNSSFSFSLAPATQAAVPIAYAVGEGGYAGAPKPRWSAWLSSFGGGSSIDGDAATGSHDLSASAYGFAMGADYQASRKTTLGLAFSGGSTSWSLSEGLGGGSSQDYQLGLNGAMRWEKIYAMAALAYGFHQMSSERAVPGGGVIAGFDAQSLSGRIESGARFKTQTGSFVTPYAALQGQAHFVPGYGEDDPSGTGFALSYNESFSTSTRAEFGARFEHTLGIGDETRLNLGARLAYAHDWLDDPTLVASFQSLPGASFTVNGAVPPADFGLASFGAELILDKNLSLLARFEGAFAPSATSCSGIGTVRMSW